MNYLEFIKKEKFHNKYWENKENILNFLKFVFLKENYNKIEDWYKCSIDDIKKYYKNINCLFKIYKNLPQLLYNCYDNSYIFLPWKFKRTPRFFWDDIDNQKQYMDWLFKELGYTKIEDWYNITKNNFEENYGSGLLQKYNNSPKKIINRIYSNYTWLQWKFNFVDDGFWDDINNQKQYMDWLFKELGYTKIEDWYNIKKTDFEKNQGDSMLSNQYKNCIKILIKNIYPEYNWLQWKFNMVDEGFWNFIDNQKQYMDWLFKELGYTKIEDWYNITKSCIENNNGRGLTNIYKNSTQLLIKSIYPEYNWLQWKFINVQDGFWDDINNQKQYMDWLFKELGYTKIEDWYNISSRDICVNYGSTLIIKVYKGYIKNLLKNIYDWYNWDDKKFIYLKGESILNEFLILSYKNLKRNCRFEWCKSTITNYYLPFDFYIEDLKLLIELDGRQHFEKVLNWEEPEKIRERDKYKMEKSIENNYTIIRLFWDDIYYNKNNWKEKLTFCLKKYDVPKIIFTNEIYKKYYNFINSGVEGYYDAIIKI